MLSILLCMSLCSANADLVFFLNRVEWWLCLYNNIISNNYRFLGFMERWSAFSYSEKFHLTPWPILTFLGESSGILSIV